MAKLHNVFLQKHHILCLIILLLAITSCTKYRNCDELLATADSLMETRPDSALTLLDSMYIGTVPLKKPDRMRCLLLLAKAQNKVYATMPTDSIFEEVVAYYDRHGSSNDQVLAHFLLMVVPDKEPWRSRWDAIVHKQCIVIIDVMVTGKGQRLLGPFLNGFILPVVGP